MRKRYALPIVGAVAGLALAIGAPQATATTATAATQNAGVTQVFCETPNGASYFKLYLRGVITPGGGPVCYDGKGTARLNLNHVVRFDSGAHSGQFTYRFPPSDAVRTMRFGPHQVGYTPEGVEVLTLTLN
ncbi:MAG: hypothetical protein ACRDQ5_21215 [Sciscionella sp.]